MLFHEIIYIIFLICFAYCFLSVGYLFILSLAGRLRPGKGGRVELGVPTKKIAILVPAYKEDGIIVSTANNLLASQYPSTLYDVFIIADSFRPDTLAKLRELPVKVLEVSFEQSTKTKALNEAFGRIDEHYDIALIADADNMIAGDFLQRVNNAFVGGARAVQGKRVAKNLDTPFAILDACSEAINNHIFRQGNYALGLSSAVIGSGMAFEFATVRQVLSEIKAVGGFDKILQLRIVEQGIRIHYLPDALIFDEKVESPEAFQQQRKRWVSSQVTYLKRFFRPACRLLFKGNLSYFNLAVAGNLVPPRAFLFLLLPLLAVAGFFLSVAWGIAGVLLAFVYVLALLMGVPSELVNKDLFRALLRLPQAIVVMAGTLFHIKKANKTFIHTAHTKTEITNTLYKDSAK